MTPTPGPYRVCRNAMSGSTLIRGDRPTSYVAVVGQIDHPEYPANAELLAASWSMADFASRLVPILARATTQAHLRAQASLAYDLGQMLAEAREFAGLLEPAGIPETVTP